ncbi:cytochrome c biogenesis heme-transporting ATPase CcmA [Alkalimonas amylolytica]|uniref:Heme exporter protein A n=1 Tax=Alkalimonas amylolytica TaxID=152573 RepID=A0A1H4BM59_ALKAM|nr:cytochrome c biogenesis heme-transporting ATPase CcmA [Alkalimonas amylolytica]SEA48902.1 heme exporter protein A [Alkalimonas amylolytica]
MTNFLCARGLSCIRQDRVLFEALDLELSPGQLLQIQGKNGAGKSSLLRLLAGLSTPDDGNILFCGQPLALQAEQYAASLCYIGHQSGIHEHLTAVENIAFWRAAYQLPFTDSMDLLGQLGLAGLEDIPCRMLSAGQQRRVSLARLWLTQAQLWILDEPFTALDQQAIQRLQQRFHQHLAAEGAIIVTTHQALSQDFPTLKTLELAYRW